MWFLLTAFLVQSVDYQAEGMKALDGKRYEEAAGLFAKAVAEDPKDYGAHFHLALSYSLLGKDAEAIPEYKTVLELKPGLYEAELNLGIGLLRGKDAAQALSYLKAASEQKPKEFRPALYVAQAEFDTGKFAEAETGFTASLEMNANSAAAEWGLGQAIFRQGRLRDAEPHYRKAAALDPSYKSYLLQLAEAYEKEHQADAAIAIYREFPENPGAQERMGALLSESGDAKDAIPALESAVAKSPTAANRVALAQAYVKTKQLDKAGPLIAAALAIDPNDYELRMFYGRMLRDQRKFMEAAPQFLAASKLKPDAPQPWNELAAALIVGEQYAQGIAALDRVRALGAETPSHFYLRGLAYDHLHQLKDAVANYNKFLELSQGKFPDEEFKARQRARIIQHELDKR